MNTWINFPDGNARAQLSADGQTVIAAEYEGQPVTPARLAYEFCRTPRELVVLVRALREQGAGAIGGAR